MPEFRKDPLSARWVIFSPERKQRPLEFEPGGPPPGRSDAFAEGNEHHTPPEIYAIRPKTTEPNSPGWRVRVVPNLFPALRVEGQIDAEAVGFYDRMNGIGAHEVIIETPRADLPLEDQTIEGVADVLDAYRHRIQDLRHDQRLRYVLVFKNVGPLAGASLVHPHSQLIAMPVVPHQVKEKLRHALAYYETKDRCIYEDILRNEIRAGDRVVYENAGFLVHCPFASRVAFEMQILPRRQCPDFDRIGEHERMLLADAVKTALSLLARALNQPCYNLIVQTAPIRRTRGNRWHSIDQDFRWHVEILPRLTGIAGFEFGTGLYINTVLPEDAAAHLRRVRKGTAS